MPVISVTDSTANPCSQSPQVCDLCESGDFQVFALRGRHRMKLQTVICQGCGLVYTNPRMSEQENREFYKNRYWGKFKNKTVPDERFFRRRLPKIKPILGQIRIYLRPGVSVLEIGCGVGALLHSMRATVASDGTFIGIEPHQGHAQFAREAKQLDVRTGLLNEISHELKPASFDLVVMNHVLEHTPSPTEVFLTVKNLLKPRGVFVVEVPNIEAPGSRLSHFFHVAHHYAFSSRTLQRLAQKTGFHSNRVAALDGDLPGTRLNAIFEKLAPTAPVPALTKFLRDDPDERAAALLRYERWYWLTAASLRKKVTHWQRQRL